jgi:hypothetical protein
LDRSCFDDGMQANRLLRHDYAAFAAVYSLLHRSRPDRPSVCAYRRSRHGAPEGSDRSKVSSWPRRFHHPGYAHRANVWPGKAPDAWYDISVCLIIRQQSADHDGITSLSPIPSSKSTYTPKLMLALSPSVHEFRRLYWILSHNMRTRSVRLSSIPDNRSQVEMSAAPCTHIRDAMPTR